MPRLLLVTAVAALLSSASLAQETPPAPAAPPSQIAPTPSPQAAPPPSDLRKVKDDDRIVAPWNLKVEDVEDMDVYGPDGKELGEVEEVLEDGTGQIRAVVLEFRRSLGFGDREAIIAVDQLQLAKDRFTTNLTEEQLTALPAWTK